MKTALLLLFTLSLAACSTFGGSQASSNSNAPSQADKPFSQRVFNPNDPYHGG
jgi:hypothetical protein